MNTIYEQLGAEQLEILIDRFYDRVVVHEDLKDLFQTDMDMVKHKQTLFLTQFLGGPGLYTAEYGHPRMRMRHLPHKITPKAAEAWLRCMKDSIETLSISDELKQQLFLRFPHVAAHMVNTPDD